MEHAMAGSVAESLTLAVITSSSTPLLLLDGALVVLAVSGSFCTAFSLAPATIKGRPMASMGDGEWRLPQFGALLAATASGSAQVDSYEMELHRPGQDVRQLVVNARKLAYDDPQNIRLLVAVADVTASRQAEKLREAMIHEKGILLQEVQHRVANSLQIIASVLLQSAKRVQSDETRTHLYDAHQRVMSVAAVQKQLAASRLGDVELRTYFTDLCRSISASMIRDHDQLSLALTVDDSVTSADVSVSLGLIVTELIINALKHAYPGHRKGVIRVDYRAEGGGWTLSVGDDGVGMPQDKASKQAGLGTSIIEALSRQLGAIVAVMPGNPGTTVSIIRKA